MRFSIYQESRLGGRSSNQDRMGYLYTRGSALMILADGMGGHTRGEVAAQVALQTLAARFQREAVPALADAGAFLRESVLEAHRELHRVRAEQRLPETPRTTLVACVVQDGVAQWAHVGDSRLYLIRAGRIVARTLDHSRTRQLIKLGLLTAEGARDHPERNAVYNCLGALTDPMVEVTQPIALRPGDNILLCSDGLWGALPEREIAAVFRDRTVMRAVPELIGAALAAAGDEADNCTAVAMNWEGVDSLEAAIPAGRSVSTLGIPDGAVASTFQVVSLDAAAEPPLADDQLDEAVAEIQRAIKRAGKLVPRK